MAHPSIFSDGLSEQYMRKEASWWQCASTLSDGVSEQYMGKEAYQCVEAIRQRDR